MANIHRGHALKGEYSCHPDREMVLCAMTLGALARGRTLLDDCAQTNDQISFSLWLQSNQIQCIRKDKSWEIEGAGLTGNFSPLQSLPKGEWASFLALCLLSRDHDTLFDFGTDAELSPLASVLKQEFIGSWNSGRWSFGEPSLQWRLSPSGEIPHRQRVRILLQALLHERTITFEEKATIRDHFSGMLAFFGAPLTVETTGNEELDELARRMARLQGQKMERKVLTSLAPCKMLTGKELFIPGDPTEAAALALLASFLPDSDIVIRSVGLNPSRSGVFNALKRMGANLEIFQKRERYGDQFGSLRVQSCKRPMGRKFAGELLMTCIEEVPLLAVAASLADGETILRLPEHIALKEHDLLNVLAQNLKRAGVEVGVYEEGLVVRGREEVDANQFDSQEIPSVGLALAVLARAAHGQSAITGIDCVPPIFPDILSKLGAE